jgi:hypothetical protein
MKKLLLVTSFAAASALAGAALAAPCAEFTDVDDTSSFCVNVAWMKNRAITLGCTSTTLYCPADAVSRLAMAAFMNRLGNTLATTKLFSDANPGPVTIQNGAYGFVCLSTPHAPTYEQSAIVHGSAWGLVNAPVTWTADLWYSIDGGASFAYMSNFIPSFNATQAGMTSGSAFATMALTPGASYIFAILLRESVDAPAGTGNFTDVACHLMAEIGNRSTVAAPTPPPCDGPNLGCGDAAQGAGRQPASGLLSRNR